MKKVETHGRQRQEQHTDSLVSSNVANSPCLHNCTLVRERHFAYISAYVSAFCFGIIEHFQK